MTPSLLTYVRHLSKQDKKTLSQKALKVAEETGELAKVILPLDNAYATTHRFVERERALEEAVDIVLTALSVAYDLNFTDEEVETMMERKIEKWSMLQYKECQVSYPLPYEIHVTVRPLGTEVEDVDEFKSVCARVGVKPIVLDLQSQQGVSIMDDVMTSSKHFGDNDSAYVEAQRVASELIVYGFGVVRIKIETVPWHPAAPIMGQSMPPNCYFESHIPIIIKELELDSLYHIIPSDVHLSRNVFKRGENGIVVVMATYRAYDQHSAQFQLNVVDIVNRINLLGYSTGKTHVEFAIYDTKDTHDSAWIESAQ